MATRLLEGQLKAHWKLDSLYGATVGGDAIGSNTLNLGLCSSTTGKVYEAALFARASSQYLGIVSNANLQSLKTIAFWVKFTTISNDMTLIHKGSNATAANSSVWIKYDTGNNRIQFQVGDGGGNSATCSTTGYTFATATWYFIVCRYSTALSKISISINGTLNNSAACSLTQYVETGTFYLGRDATGSYLDGALDEVSVSQSCLTIAEELVLYNGGNANQPPFLEGPWAANGAAGRYPRRLPPSFAEADNGELFIAFGDEGVRKWDGLKTTFPFAGVPAPTTTPSIASGGEGRIIGERFAYSRFLDADGRASNLSPISDPLNAWGTPSSITGATNAAPIVITSATHGLTTGEQVYINGVQGNTAANGVWTVTVVDANTFSLDTSAGNGDFLGTDTGRVAVTTLRDGAAAVNEVQTITASATPSGGTWTITFNGSTTSALAYDANAATVQTALRLLPSIGGANVTVSGGALGTAAFTLTFSGTLAGTNLPQVTVDDSSLLGASVTVSVVTLTQGSPAQSEVQQFQLYGTPTGGTFTLTFSGQTTAAIAYNAANATIDTALENLSNIGAGDITIGGGPLPGSAVTVTFGNAMANTNVAEMTINGASLTGGSISATVSTITPGVTGLSSSNRAWWKFDETSGTRYDSVGSFDLSETAAALSSTSGILNNAVSLPNNGTDNLLFDGSASYPRTSSNFTLCCWFQQASDPGTATTFFTLSSTGAVFNGDFTLGRTAGNRFTASVSQGGSVPTTTATTFGAIPSATWCFVAVRWNVTTKVVRISVNAGASDSSAAGSGAFDDSSATGSQIIVSAPTTAANLAIDESGFWSRELSDAELTTLYNGGAASTSPFSSGTNEVQRITVAGSPGQGSFTLTFGAATSAAIPYNSSAAAIDTILEAMSTIGSGNVSCSGGPLPGSTVDVTFTGSLAATDVAQMTANDNLLKTSITTTTQGDPGTNEIQRISASPTPLSGTFTLTFDGQTTAALDFDATAAEIDTALEALSNIGAGDLTCAGGPLNSAPITVTFGGTLAATNVAEMTATSSLLGDDVTLTPATTTDGSAAVNEQQQVFVAGTLTGGTYTLTTNSQVTSAQSYIGNATDLDTALEVIWGTGNIATSGGPLPLPITVEWQGTQAGTNIAEMTVSNSVTGGGWARGAQYLVYSNVEVPTDRRVTKRQVLRNKFGDATVFYIDLEDTTLTGTTLTSYHTDEELTVAVPLQDSSGNDLNVVRHGEPPNWKRAIASFQNRLFLGVNHRSTSGELSVTNASTTITGEDAFFRTAYDTRFLSPQQSSNDQGYTIDSLSVPNQTLTVNDTYVGSTVNGLAYGIEMAQPEDLVIYYSEEDDPESWNLLNGLTITRCIEDGNFVGVMPLINSVVFVMQHRLHRLTFRTSPQPASNGGDGRIAPASWRGGVNNRCYIVAEGKAYVLDNRGCYTFNESAAENISDEIDTMFAPGHAYSVYWPAREYFHGCYFAEDDTMKWFVTLRDGTYPHHAICYHTQRKRWWIEEYPWPVVSSCEGHINGHQVVFLGSTQHRIFVMGADLDGISVGVPNTLRGTVTSSGAFSLTDSTATFSTSLLANVLVTIVSGKGAGQQRIIVSSTATKLTLKDAWNIAPDTTSVYQIGGVKWTWKGTQLRLSQKGSEADRGVETTFLPTDRAATITLRTYADFSETANQLAMTLDDSDGASVKKDSGDVILDLTHTTGFIGFYNDAFFTGRGTHQRYVTAELEGVTNGERQKISEVSIVGVEG